MHRKFENKGQSLTIVDQGLFSFEPRNLFSQFNQYFSLLNAQIFVFRRRFFICCMNIIFDSRSQFWLCASLFIFKCNCFIVQFNRHLVNCFVGNALKISSLKDLYLILNGKKVISRTHTAYPFLHQKNSDKIVSKLSTGDHQSGIFLDIN